MRFLALLGCLLAFASPIAAQITPTVGFTADANTIALYRFDEGTGTTFLDASGNGHDGTLTGASWTTGLMGSAASFDGSNDYGLVPHSTDFNVSSTDDFTMETWVKAGSAGTWFVKGQRFID